MIPPGSIMRVARPTDNLQAIEKMYAEGLGFEILTRFEWQDGYDGIVLGHEKHPYHLAFFHHRGTSVGRATADNLIAFYIPDSNERELMDT